MRARNSSKKVSEHDPGGRYKQVTEKHFLEEPTEMMGCSKVSKHGESTILTGTPFLIFLSWFVMELETYWCYRFQKSICVARAYVCFSNCEKVEAVSKKHVVNHRSLVSD